MTYRRSLCQAQRRRPTMSKAAAGRNEISGMQTFLTSAAAELAGMIVEGDASSVEIVEAHLARIEAVGPKLNAVVRLAPDALDRACEADRALARGEAVGPLHGVPFTVKDWIETADLVCDAGYAERRDYRPARDATAVARMRAAGA